MRFFILVILATITIRLSADPLDFKFDYQTNHFVINLGSMAITSTIGDGTPPESRDLVNDPVLGSGKVTIVTGMDGETLQIISTDGPFIFFRHTISNKTTAPVHLNRVPMLSFSPDLGKPLSALKIRAYSGLGPANQVNSGDYEWLVVADPESNAGMVCGFVSQYRSTGVLTRSVEGNQLTLKARSEYGNLLLDPGQTTESEVFAIGLFPDVRVGLEKYADQIAQNYHVKLHSQPAGYCTWYANKHGGCGDEGSSAYLAQFIHDNLLAYGLNFVQVDDGWQMGQSKNGPRKNFTQFNPNGSYKSGGKANADKLKNLSVTPGIWFMPFAGTFNDPWYADKQDLFAKNPDGTPFDTPWGGTCFDLTNPSTQDYLRTEVKQISHDWGYTYFKMDGFSTGCADQPCYINTAYKDTKFGTSILHDPHKTQVEALRTGIGIVRQAAGPDVFFLGCSVAQNMRSYGGSFGTLDAMRIGPDNIGSWSGWAGDSPLFGCRNYFLNGRVWYNDPDPSYVRSSMTLDQARTAASWAAISGQLYTNSDWIPDLPADRLEIIKRTCTPHGKVARPIDFLTEDKSTVWEVLDEKAGRYVVALYNFTERPKSFSVPISNLYLPKAESYAAFDFWGNAFLPKFTDTITATLPPTSCQIIAIRPLSDHPFVLSTSRHVTQGMVELSDETWDAQSRVLSGKSQVIAGDPYEMRLVLPDGMKMITAKVDSGATASVSVDRGSRVMITPSATGVVNWQIAF